MSEGLGAQGSAVNWGHLGMRKDVQVKNGTDGEDRNSLADLEFF